MSRTEVSDDLFVLMRRSWAVYGVKFLEFCVSMYIAEKQYVCDFLNGTSWTSGFAKRRRTQAVKKTSPLHANIGHNCKHEHLQQRRYNITITSRSIDVTFSAKNQQLCVGKEMTEDRLVRL